MKSELLLCGLLALSFQSAVIAKPLREGKPNPLKDAVVLIIRHAEKPDAGEGLSSDGTVRANAYVHYLTHFTVSGQPLKLDYLVAAADSKASHRPRLTLEPISMALGLAIDNRFSDKQFQELADELQARPHGKAILIAWHHGEIPSLLRALGADPEQVIPGAKWREDVFGWLIQLRYDSKGKLFEAKRINVDLMPDDSNKHSEM